MPRLLTLSSLQPPLLYCLAVETRPFGRCSRAQPVARQATPARISDGEDGDSEDGDSEDGDGEDGDDEVAAH
jgi:hypothetical protein